MKGNKALVLTVIGIMAIFVAAVATRNMGQAAGDKTEVPQNQTRMEKKLAESPERGKVNHSGEEGEKQEEEKLIRLPENQMEKFGIQTETAGPGKLDVLLSFPAEVVVNSDRTAQIVPRLTGVVSDVRKNLADIDQSIAATGNTTRRSHHPRIIETTAARAHDSSRRIFRLRSHGHLDRHRG